MKATRITSKDLLMLADDITRLAKKASNVGGQSGVQTELNAALANVLAGAKTTAFVEAMEKHNREVTEEALPGLVAEPNGGDPP